MDNCQFICEVCTNPTTIFSRKVGKWDVKAYIAQSPNGKWDYGYLAYYDDGGVVCPVMLQKGDKGLSEEKAREQALKAIESNVRLTQVTDIEGRSRLLDIIWNEMNSK